MILRSPFLLRRLPALILLAVLLHAPALARGRPFAVTDAIEMTRIVEPVVGRRMFATGEPPFSPDGSHFFIITSRGNLAGNHNEHRLLVFSSAAVTAFLRNERSDAGAVTAATFRSDSNRAGIWKARWLGNDRIAFLAENPGETSQVHVVGKDGSGLRRITAHPTPVMDFDTNDSGGVVFAAVAPGGWTEEERSGAVIGVEFLWDLQERNRGGSFYTRLRFHAQGPDGRSRPVEMAPFEVRGGGAFGMWLAPDGRHAVSLVHVADSADSWWTDYAPVASNDYFRLAGSRSAFRGFTSEHREVFLQYMLIDMASGAMRPLVDAPSGLYFGGFNVGAHWLDANRIILTNTFLPLGGVGQAERGRRQAAPAAVAVEIGSGAIQRIADLPVPRSGTASSGELAGSSLTAPDLLTLNFFGREGARRQSWRRSGRGWAEVPTPAAAGRPFALDFPQDINTPPDLRATLVGGGQAKLLTRLNPQFAEIEMVRAEVVELRTADGRTVRAGLVPPGGARPDRRYPLVIQTHGFEPDSFLVTGPGGSPSGYAARALAAQGIAVLQMPDVSSGSRAQLEQQMQTYRAGVDLLVARGLVDPARVGMHGWSRTGTYVQHAATFSDLNLRAATVSDPDYLSQLHYALYFGAGYPGMINDERLIGASTWGEEGARAWARNDPMLNLHRFTAPIRMEMYGRTLGGWWDVYTALRRNGRPAEYVYYPDGQHVLTRPREQLTSQQGNVDWYRFWLAGEEDRDPAKAEQYRRWRALREEAARPPVAAQ